MTLSEYLSALEALDRAATEGPWFNQQGTVWIEGVARDTKGEPYPTQEKLADSNEVDASFIAASRSALPFLCKVVRAQAEVIRALERRHQPGLVTGKDIKDLDGAELALSTLLAELKT